jgi:hypothetical protein
MWPAAAGSQFEYKGKKLRDKQDGTQTIGNVVDPAVEPCDELKQQAAVMI